MKILYSWLREFVATPLSPLEVASALTMAGIEVSSCRFLGEGLEDIVAARILDMRPHPNADKLLLCRVTDGAREYRIVCGAKNMKAGDVVPLSRVGAKLPSGMEIRKAKIRGEVSEGMLCSEAELGLSEKAAGIMILPPDTPIGGAVADAVGLNDWLLEIEVTPNRGDCLSVVGVAREVAAVGGGTVAMPEVSFPEEDADISSLASVTVTDADLCPRYCALVITGVSVAPSPAWLARRLALCGIRPINNIVDITNYVLLELGQPMHAFDLDRLHGARIDVRRSGSERLFQTLDGVSRRIDADMLLIWDGKEPVAVAGVMGGLNSEVLPATTRVLFESAHFDPLSIRRTARRLGLASESSYRFERGVDPSGALYAARRAVSLLCRSARFKAARGAIDVGGGRRFERIVPFRPRRASHIIGRDYTAEECCGIFHRLGFGTRKEEGETFSVTVPPHRFDIEREIDLVEEVARLAGYDSIPATYPPAGAPDFSEEDRLAAILEKSAEHLRIHGFSQAVNLSFVSEKEWARHAEALGFDPADAIRLKNPISDDTTMMRPHLLMGLLHNVQSNLRRFQESVRLFEIGKAFARSLKPRCFEEPRLAFVAYGARMPSDWSGRDERFDFHDIKGVAESLLAYVGAGPVHFVRTCARPFFEEGKAADIVRDGEVIGWTGAVRRILLEKLDIPGAVYYCEIRIQEAVPASETPAAFREFPKFPPVLRDYSCIFPTEVAIGDVTSMIAALGPEVESASVFDVYTGEKIGAGRKSVAIRVRFQAADRTLTDVAVDSIHTKILKLLENRFGGQIRSR